MGLVADGLEAARSGRRELVRYAVSDGERAVYGEMVDGAYALVDVPVGSCEGQLFTVDPRWRNEWMLESFLERYAEVGEVYGRCPVEPDLEAEAWEDADPDAALAEIYWRIGRS